MPWVRDIDRQSGLKGRENLCGIGIELIPTEFSRPFRPQECSAIFTQGIGLPAEALG
jgi:hypothetical protein